jgi:hypothetical protein
MLYNIVHIIPDPRLHILNGYNDVIKSIYWGLRALGNEVEYSANSHRDDGRNIVLGANMAHFKLRNQWPTNTIVYNLEQIAPALENPAMRNSYLDLSNRFEIWDYSEQNIESWKQINPDCRPKLVPIGFAPVLERIKKPETQDIDVLFYGGPARERLEVFKDLCHKGMTAIWAFGLYDEARDALIARSKLVLNISHGHAEIFSIVRVSFLLANHKAVIADLHPNLSVEADMFNAVQFTPVERFTETCLRYVEDEAARLQLERNAYIIMTQRDIRAILAKALEAA